MATETLLDLLRHGETEGGARLRGARCDDRLSDAGTAQLWAATAADPGWTGVATSPQARCREFAERLAAAAGLELCVDARLREYDFGDWDGQPLERLWREHGDALARFFGDPDAVVPPNGERAADFRARIRAARDELLERHRGGHLLLVGHGGVLRQLVADVLGGTGNLHSVLEWPHAAMTRVRVVDDPPFPRSQSLVWHGRAAAP